MKKRSDLDKLEKAALAIPAPFLEQKWKTVPGTNGKKGHYKGVSPNIVWDAHPEIAEYIAAANPGAILDLIRRVRAAEAS